MLAISPFNFKQNVKYNQSFKGNENTRILLENLDEDEFYHNGRPRIQKLSKNKQKKLLAYRRAVPNKTIYSGCLKKVRYATEHAAEAARRAVEAKKHIAMAIYDCPLCQGFHVCQAAHKYTRNIPV